MRCTRRTRLPDLLTLALACESGVVSTTTSTTYALVPAESVDRRDGAEWIADNTIRARLLIGAGGSGCPVARMVNGPGHGGRPLVVAREAESRLGTAELATIATEPDVPELFFCRDLQGRMIDDGVMLIGDAAGVADPQSGEGIRQAIVAGQLLRVPAVVKRIVLDEWFLHRRQPALAG